MAGGIPEIDNGWGIPEIEIDNGWGIPEIEIDNGWGDSRDRDR